MAATTISSPCSSPAVYANPSSEVSNAAEGRFSANGNLELQNYFSLDGIDNNTGSENLQEQSAQAVYSAARCTAGVSPGKHAPIQQNLAPRPAPSSMPRPSPELTHFTAMFGSIYANSALDANTFFKTTTAAHPKDTSHRANSAEQPAVRSSKDHAFFFGAYQGLLSSRAQTVYSTVPTPAMKSGDFSALSSSYTLTAVADGQAGCIVANIVNPSCIDPVGQTLLNLYPDPNFPNVGAPYTGAPN